MTTSTYLQMLYSAALIHLNESKPLPERLAALYTLYTLFHTQITEPKTLIYICYAEVEQMLFLLQQIKELHLADAYHVMRKLFLDGSFLVGAVQSSITAPVNRAVKLTQQSRKRIDKTTEKILSTGNIKSHFHYAYDGESLPLDEVISWESEYQTIIGKSIADGLVDPTRVSAGDAPLPGSTGQILVKEFDEYMAAEASNMDSSRLRNAIIGKKGYRDAEDHTPIILTATSKEK